MLTPGPTNLLEEAQFAMLQANMHHRSSEFQAIFIEVKQQLAKALNMPEVLMLSSSGTGAMQAAVANSGAKKLLVINAGKFGERFSLIAKSLDIEVVQLNYEWNTPANANEVVETLKKHGDIDAIALQVCESSAGLRHPVEQIAKLAKAYHQDIVIIVDAITALLVEKIDSSHIDFLVGGSQKAFMLPPGLSLLGLSQNIKRRLQADDIDQDFYFNLKNELKNQAQGGTAFTPAISLIVGMKAVLQKFFSYEEQAFYAQVALRHQAMTKAVQSLDLAIFPKAPALSMVTIYHEKASTIIAHLKQQYQVHIAKGQGDYKNYLMRISNLGFIKPEAMLFALNALELSLADLGIRAYDGSAARIFSEGFLLQ